MYHPKRLHWVPFRMGDARSTARLMDEASDSGEVHNTGRSRMKAFFWGIKLHKKRVTPQTIVTYCKIRTTVLKLSGLKLWY